MEFSVQHWIAMRGVFGPSLRMCHGVDDLRDLTAHATEYLRKLGVSADDPVGDILGRKWRKIIACYNRSAVLIQPTI